MQIDTYSLGKVTAQSLLEGEQYKQIIDSFSPCFIQKKHSLFNKERFPWLIYSESASEL